MGEDFMKIISIVLSMILFSACGELHKIRKVANGVTGKDTILAKDLSKLPSDEVIKTKYNKLYFYCSYKIAVEKVTNGTIISQNKISEVGWNILTNTVFTKDLNHQDQVLNLNFNYQLQAKLNLDNKFNSQINLLPKYEIKTTDDNGNVVTSMKSDSNSSTIILDENHKTTLLEITTGATSVSGINKIMMECYFESIVKPEYQ